jgi:hypothetical protein
MNWVMQLELKSAAMDAERLRARWRLAASFDGWP